MKENRLAPATHSMASDSKELPLDKGKHFYKRTKQSLRHNIPKFTSLKAVRIDFFLILKVANIRCFMLIAGEIFHNIICK